MRTAELFAFIRERESIRVHREAGLPKPWTDDPILQSYRFCNVYREYDTETLWFAKNWRIPHAKDPDMWFASLVFRFVNWHQTAVEIGYPVPWDPAHFKRTLQLRKKQGNKVYSGAYMISTHGVKEEKHAYLAKSLSKIWRRREEIRYRQGEYLTDFHQRLMNCFDVGSFIAGQVIADAKYCGNMYHTKDWWTFAASGPGSRRGLNRVMGNPVDKPWKEATWYTTLTTLKAEIDPFVRQTKVMMRIHAQDLQNCLCEFDKYERVRLGEGKPKQRYNGKGN
jgi:hypothetical protein